MKRGSDMAKSDCEVNVRISVDTKVIDAVTGVIQCAAELLELLPQWHYRERAELAERLETARKAIQG
jgi:hypothetical protein